MFFFLFLVFRRGTQHTDYSIVMEKFEFCYPMEYRRSRVHNYLKWLKEPQTLDANWRLFFEGFHLGADSQNNESISEVSSLEKSSVEVVDRNDAVEKHARLYGAIYSYRDIGHTQEHLIP